MIADRGRTDAYDQALRARLTPHSEVLDIGAGPGILTLLACQAAGDQIAVGLRADLLGGDYIWSWDTEIRGGDSRGAIKAQFRQSESLGHPLSADWLRKSNPSFVPSPNPEASIDRMDLGSSVHRKQPRGDLARAVRGTYSGGNHRPACADRSEGTGCALRARAAPGGDRPDGPGRQALLAQPAEFPLGESVPAARPHACDL